MADIYPDYAHVEALVAAHLRPAPAGIYASQFRLLRQENVVGGTFLNVALAPQDVQHVLAHTRKQFNGFAACVSSYRSVGRSANVTMLLFAPGSAQCVGAQNSHALTLNLHMFCVLLRAAGYEPEMNWVSRDNIVATGDLGYSVKLEELNNAMEGLVTVFDPHDFPGLICFTNARPHISVTLFEGGRLTVLGVQDLAEANRLYYRIASVAALHKATELGTGTGKSHRRYARLVEETTKRKLDGGVRQTRVALQSTLYEEIEKFDKQHPELQNTAEYASKLKAHVDAVVARVREAQESEARKRQKLEEEENAEDDVLCAADLLVAPDDEAAAAPGEDELMDVMEEVLASGYVEA